jgi:hypothetical protein
LGAAISAAGVPGARTLLRRFSPIAATFVSVALVATFLPSLPTSNPFVASGAPIGNVPFGIPSATPGGSPSPGSTPSIGTSVGPGGVAQPGQTLRATANYNPYFAPNQTCKTYQGVFCDHIDTVFHYNTAHQCPQDQDLSPFLFALGVNLDPPTNLKLLVPYFNDHAQSLYPPQYANAFKAGGFWGRKINPILRSDDGGPFCPDQNSAAAVEYATQDKAFAVMGGGEASSEGSGDIIQSTIASYHVMSIEPTWSPDSVFKADAPYAWSAVPSGETAMRHVVNYICNYLKYHNSFNMPDNNGTPDPVSANKPRVFSIVNNEREPEHTLAAEFKPRIQACGAKYGTQVEYHSNLADAEQQATSARAKLQAAGTTTEVFFGSSVAAEVGAINDAAADWHHEWLISDFGFLDSPAVVDGDPDSETAWFYGVAESNGYVHAKTPFCNTPWGKIWCDAHNRDPNTYGQYPPSDYELWFVELFLYGAQLISAGPGLNPQNVQQGLFQGCSPCPAEIGISYPTMAGFGPRWPEGAWSTAKDYELVRWDPNLASPYEAQYKDPKFYKGACGGNTHSSCGTYAAASDYPQMFPGLPDPNLGWKRWFDWNVLDPPF